ncbi:hypothetical protein TL16_g05201 [Triparma laevis f. inornata]|uniref:Tr-type G domain-containing protein n=1 Tax=Triparma laevis f. inornata TaxID=1714386 RepID=A0A9W7E8R6_9STRA|nr:hypothetical protein TL16_g05201 [Triparma laevis f. inornata]
MPIDPITGEFVPAARPAFNAAPPTKPPFDAAPPTRPPFDAAPPTKPSFNAAPPTKPAFDAAPPSKPSFDARTPAFGARPPVSIGISSKPAASISSIGTKSASISSKPAASMSSIGSTSRSASISSKPPPAPAPASAPAPMEEDSDKIDESDPLFVAVLKIANNDKEKALKMISDPDSLMHYPEIVKILEETSGDGSEEDLAGGVSSMDIEDDGDLKPSSKDVEMVEEESAVVEAVTDEGDPREHLNLVFIGHVDAGKSTLSGNILYLTDNVDKRTIERYEREAKDRNRESWFLAFIMDTNEEERAKGKTVEVGRAYFDTEVKRYTILDAPGHKNYVPNMIMGASQADVGVLVISARKGEFEAGFEKGGQSREHAMLCKTLGISHMVVVINKMDDPTVQWSKERFDQCVTKLRPFLKSCGYMIKKEVKFIPISGLSGANVKDEVSPTECPWWKKSCAAKENNTCEPTLLQLFDKLVISGREASASVRIPLLDRYTDRGTIAMGKVESGTIRQGQKVTIMPTRQQFKIEGVWANEKPVACARPGENVLIKIGGASVEEIQKGYVICSKDDPCRGEALRGAKRRAEITIFMRVTARSEARSIKNFIN